MATIATNAARGNINNGGLYNPIEQGSSPFVRGATYYLKSHWKVLVLGQILSFLLATAGAAQSSLHLNCELSAPTFTMSLIYMFLSFHLLLVFRRHRQRSLGEGVDLCLTSSHEEEEEPNSDKPQVTSIVDEVKLASPLKTFQYSFMGLGLHRPIWRYLIIAFIDVEANAITMLSFRYTTLTSVTLFDALAIPSSMIISRCFLGRRYTWIHVLGVVFCMIGVVMNAMQDYESDRSSSTEESSANDGSQEFPHKFRGDVLAITGGILYGLNNVLVEVTVRGNGDTAEYLGVMGFFGFVVSAIQALILEYEDILEFFGRRPDASATCSLEMGWFVLFVFVTVTILSYCGASRFLLMSEAAFFSLSLLTGDLWSVAFSVFAQKIIPRPFFFVALVFVLSGVILYETSPSPVLEDGELILGDNSDEVNTSVLEQEMKHGNNSFDFELPVLKSGLT